MSGPLVDWLNWLYPPICKLCQISLRGDANLCTTCLGKLPITLPNSCRTCGQGFDGDFPAPDSCPDCLALNPSFDFATAALRANDTTLELIHQFKLMGQLELGNDFARLCAHTYRNDPRLNTLADPVFIPVPLHRKRLLRRRFNQAAALSRPLSRELAIPELDALKRIRATSRQATLTRKQRLANLHKAFRLRVAPEKLQNRDLILIDDVLTTGSTAQECAKVLRTAKPRSIIVLTVMRA